MTSLSSTLIFSYYFSTGSKSLLISSLMLYVDPPLIFWFPYYSSPHFSSIAPSLVFSEYIYRGPVLGPTKTSKLRRKTVNAMSPPLFPQQRLLGKPFCYRLQLQVCWRSLQDSTAPSYQYLLDHSDGDWFIAIHFRCRLLPTIPSLRHFWPPSKSLASSIRVLCTSGTGKILLVEGVKVRAAFIMMVIPLQRAAKRW